MARRHIVRKADRQPQAIDLGTPERARQAGGLVKDTCQLVENGRVVRQEVMRAKAECALDALLINGALGEDDEAVRRYKAGEWLRGLHLAAHPTRTAMSWQLRNQEHREMSDKLVWNLKCLAETFRELGKYRAVVEAVCCDDRGVADITTLRLGLDQLAKLRGL